MENEQPKTEEKKKSNNPLLEESRVLAERIEKASAEAKAQADRLEQLRSEQLLSGSGGIRPQINEKSEAEMKKEGAMNMFKGTEIEKALKRHG